jgi:hypothetical protein
MPRSKQPLSITYLFCTVHRVLADREVDEKDKWVTTDISKKVSSHADFLDFITRRIAGEHPALPSGTYDNDLSDTLWLASENFENNPLPSGDTKAMRNFARDLLEIGQGDKEVAQKWEPFVERCAHTYLPVLVY